MQLKQLKAANRLSALLQLKIVTHFIFFSCVLLLLSVSLFVASFRVSVWEKKDVKGGLRGDLDWPHDFNGNILRLRLVSLVHSCERCLGFLS